MFAFAQLQTLRFSGPVRKAAMHCRLSIFIACALLGSAAHGAQLPRIAFLSMGYREATIADFASSPQAPWRRADPRAYLAVTADFNGDGEADEARILLNEQRGVAHVVAVIRSPSSKLDTYVLSHMPLESAKNVGITLAKPLASAGPHGRVGVTVFNLDSGQGEAAYFDGEEFDVRVAVTAEAPKSR